MILVIGGIYLIAINTRPAPTPGSYTDLSYAVSGKYDPNLNRYAARREAGTALSRAELLANLNQEVQAMAQWLNSQTDLKLAQMANHDADLTYQAMIARHELDARAYYAQTQNQIAANEMATRYGLTPGGYQELVISAVREQAAQTAMENRMQLDVRRDELMKHNEFLFQQKLDSLDVYIAQISSVMPQRQQQLLGSMLQQIHGEFEAVKKMPDGEYKERELRRLEEQRKALENVLYEP